MIGASRVAIGRAFGLLKNEGALEVKRHLIYVTDREVLTRLAEAR